MAAKSFIEHNVFTGQPASSELSPRNRRGGVMLGMIVAFWSLAIVTGLAMLWQHGFVAGPVANAEQTWPGGVMLPKPSGVPTLIMTVHPECPCSRASVDELEVLMSRYPGKVHAYVLFAEYAGLKTPVESSNLWKLASNIPGVNAMVDNDAAMTRAFGAQTSGQVFVYDTAGALRFSGGLTASRGHEGDNDGLTAVEGILNSKQEPVKDTPVKATPLKQTPVYGCKIW